MQDVFEFESNQVKWRAKLKSPLDLSSEVHRWRLTRFTVAHAAADSLLPLLRHLVNLGDGI